MNKFNIWNINNIIYKKKNKQNKTKDFENWLRGNSVIMKIWNGQFMEWNDFFQVDGGDCEKMESYF